MRKYIKESPSMQDPWGYKIKYNKFFEYVDLPDPPAEFILELDEIKNLPQISKNKEFSPNYDLCPAQEKLKEWVKKNIPNSTATMYHWMNSNFHIHTDWSRIECWNYIINPGGPNAYTSFYDANHNLLEQHVIEPNRWHWMNVSILHNVSNFSGVRYGITVSGKRGIRNYKE